MTDKEWFDAPWRTTNQTRDLLLSLEHNLTEERIKEIRSLARATNEFRKTREFIQCQRCYGYHGMKETIDALCEQCEEQTAPYRYDTNRLLS